MDFARAVVRVMMLEFAVFMIGSSVRRDQLNTVLNTVSFISTETLYFEGSGKMRVA